MAFDTCGPLLGVALWCDGEVTERVHESGRGSDTRLLPLAQELLEAAMQPVVAVQGLAVAAGPGAFTGLRVGLATAAGLAQSLDVPMVLADSLHMRALAAGLDHDEPEQERLVMLDARKGRVYASAFRGGRLAIGPADVAPSVALGWVRPGFRVSGQGAVVYGEEVAAAGGVLCAKPEDPGVGSLCRWAAAELAAGRGVRATEVRPRYVREPDAVKPVPAGAKPRG